MDAKSMINPKDINLFMEYFYDQCRLGKFRSDFAATDQTRLMHRLMLSYCTPVTVKLR
ncbi:hypothetical protein FDUTEX481_02050 [Tolypothrix sp. PCC 7601]|nr:hypothetical protein FDUTEX481_02050 [Tolypothrix sp. PCC 7601]